MTISTNRDSDRYIIRMPDGMRDRLKAAAAANNRSLNAEIVARLERTLAETPFPSFQEEVMERVVERVIRRVVDEKPETANKK